ncbi:host specificity protein [Thioclava sp. SK-1]|uniref:baseplate multidomain protein megatron n=1 Tax=Thioclava sp. SK-1 TaxID=1889770 RepID=UPI0008255E34|nr:glycoside hydrolase TIM-barrel-like domain-containing protein [Thioclava sp. SK-1]OCX67038.1 host specificity protein [Thioclava sp. SK-1]
MATILLSAAGAAIGGGFGGSVLGLSGAVIGRAVGATLGMAIDNRLSAQLVGGASNAVETGRAERFRLSSAGEGEPVGRIWGAMRLSGQVIWATRFMEHSDVSSETTGGKATAKVATGVTTTTTSYSYSVSLALALCEGEILRVARVWADGNEIDPRDLDMRVYTGAEDQQPDPKIMAVEGEDAAPAYRGIAYVVIEGLPLAAYGNRVPQFSFEVMRAAQSDAVEPEPDLVRGVQAVALIPGTGEYALATEPVYMSGDGIGAATVAVNQNATGAQTDFLYALDALHQELPACKAVSLVVSWFGDDLRCGSCTIRPHVDTEQAEGRDMPWRVSGVGRAQAGLVPLSNGTAVYGGTPSDRSVIQAIQALRAAGQSVTFYPFILMTQLSDNGLPDPWSDAQEQPALPWRGRITTAIAPGRAGSADQTDAADAEVATFFGTATLEDFTPGTDTVTFAGEEWSFRRFILHYAHLCAQAGGVDAFCIGTEMRSLTQIRGSANRFPAVHELIALAADVRAILGHGCKISYAADWSEYFGYQPGNGDRFFHLDPLWADSNIDFIGVDNYLPLSDWRDGEDHLDASWGAIHNLDYLQANIAGGEYYDWYYAYDAHRDAQIRTPITDDHGEEWVWRAKDFRNWWGNAHHERIGGVRSHDPTVWVPGSKPIWFTEFGCAAIDKGTNQPNKFLDPKSSESSLPYYSDGRRDEALQMQYLRAMIAYWGQQKHNPDATLYDGAMIDMTRAHVWCWDTRPSPQFPAYDALWSDAQNYARGHWISGRAVAQPLSNVVADVCADVGLYAIDVRGLVGTVRGLAATSGQTPRAVLQSLMMAYGFEAVERDGVVRFQMRNGWVDAQLAEEDLALGEGDRTVQRMRMPEAETAGRVRLSYLQMDADYESRMAEAVFPDEAAAEVTSACSLPLTLSTAAGQATVERWLAEARVSRDRISFALPLSLGDLGPGDVVDLTVEGIARRYRIDRVERAGISEIEAVRIEPGVYRRSDEAEERIGLQPFVAPVPVTPVFLDLPLLTGQEIPHTPHLAVSAIPWPGSVALWSSQEDDGYMLNTVAAAQSVIGVTQNALGAAPAGMWDNGPALRVKLMSGALASASQARVLNGANAVAIRGGDTADWEVFQFTQAQLISPGVYDLRGRLRGQCGTDAVMPDTWPEGSIIVLLNDAVGQIDLPAGARNLARHYRIGPAGRGYDDPSYIHRVEAFAGVGLRPFRPVHLRMHQVAGDMTFDWLRRTRRDGDSWEGFDVPLGEEQEHYMLRVVQGEAVIRETTVSAPHWTYTAQMAADDGLGAGAVLTVAQMSDLYGPGPFAQLKLDNV